MTNTEPCNPRHPRTATGLLLGLSAVLLWSFTSSLICLGADALGTWRFIAISTLTGGTLQMVFRRVRHGELRSALILPARLWLVTLLGFVLYGVIYPIALALGQTDAQRCGVNLINYLWPTLTVVFGVLLVPSNRFNRAIAFAVVLALGGTLLANLGPIRETFATHRDGGAWSAADLVPYVLALAGATMWAFYNAMLARWRDWAHRYGTSAIGLVMIGVIAVVAGIATGTDWSGLGSRGILMGVLCGLGPFGCGYMLWELALTRADVRALGLLGAMTPVLSTLWLCVFLRFVPGLELVAAAVLVSVAVVVGMRS